MSYACSDKRWLEVHKPGFTEDDLEFFVERIGMGVDGSSITLKELDDIRKQALFDLNNKKLIRNINLL